MIQFLFGGILLLSQIVLVLLFYVRRLENWIFAQAKLKLFIVDSTKKGVVGLIV